MVNYSGSQCDELILSSTIVVHNVPPDTGKRINALLERMAVLMILVDTLGNNALMEFVVHDYEGAHNERMSSDRNWAGRFSTPLSTNLDVAGPKLSVTMT